MALDLFYFISSLPTLQFEAKPFLSHKRFLASCQESLSAEENAEIQNMRLQPTTEDSPQDGVLAAWSDFETALRNTLCEMRLARFPRGTFAHTPRATKYDAPQLRKSIEEAMALGNPLDRETALDAIRWDYLTSLEAGHTFDMTILKIYALKLQILEKTFSRNVQQGEKHFQDLVQNEMQQAIGARRNI